MRLFCLFLSFLCVLTLTACGTEDDLTAPNFSQVKATGSSAPDARGSEITISGKIDDNSASIVANNLVTGENTVDVNNEGFWQFTFEPLLGPNAISFTASDVRGNFNQMVLSVIYNPTGPVVTAITPIIVVSPEVSKLVVTFNQDLLESSLPLAFFAVDGIPIVDSPLIDSLMPNVVTIQLPLSLELIPGLHKFTYTGVGDNVTSTNNVPVSYFFDFTRAE